MARRDITIVDNEPELITPDHTMPRLGHLIGWSRHSSRQSTILIVTQDREEFRSIRLKLETAGFRLLDASGGERAIALIQAEGPDLVLLDMSLPDMDGLTACEQVRRFSYVPIIIITEERSERAKIRGFTAGADDYLIKPVGVRELLARVRAVLRRTEVSGVFKSPPPVRLNGFEIHPLRHEIKTPKGKVKLTPTERQLLYYLASNAGRVLTHEQLLTEVWGPGCDYPTEHLWVNISRLRKKIEPNPSRPYYIITESGVGYYFRKLKGPSS